MDDHEDELDDEERLEEGVLNSEEDDLDIPDENGDLPEDADEESLDRFGLRDTSEEEEY